MTPVRAAQGVRTPGRRDLRRRQPGLGQDLAGVLAERGRGHRRRRPEVQRGGLHARDREKPPGQKMRIPAHLVRLAHRLDAGVESGEPFPPTPPATRGRRFAPASAAPPPPPRLRHRPRPSGRRGPSRWQSAWKNLRLERGHRQPPIVGGAVQPVAGQPAVERALPCRRYAGARVGVAPSCSAAKDVVDSTSDTSTRRPRPVAARASSAARMPLTATHAPPDVCDLSLRAPPATPSALPSRAAPPVPVSEVVPRASAVRPGPARSQRARRRPAGESARAARRVRARAGPSPRAGSPPPARRTGRGAAAPRRSHLAA